MTLASALHLAQQHAANLNADIPNAQSRIEHIRLSRLAEEAEAVVAALSNVEPENSSPTYLPTHF